MTWYSNLAVIAISITAIILPSYGSTAHPSAFHLFGEIRAQPTTDPIPTPLALLLQGIAWSSDPNTPSRVIIATPDGVAKIYGVGDTLPENAVIQRITQNEVIILHQNQLESLKLRVS